MKVLLLLIFLFLTLFANCQNITTGKRSDSVTYKNGLLCLDSAQIVQIVETKRQLTRCNDELGFYQDVVTTNDSMIMDYDKLINEMNLKNTDCKQYNDALLGQLVKAQSDFKTEHVNKNIWKAVALSIPVVLAVLLIISQK